MRTLITLIFLCLVGSAMAQTNRSVTVDATSGRLSGNSTNFVAANGLMTTSHVGSVSITGSLTVGGNATLNGSTNIAPNQTASSGSSVMTRDLVDQRAKWIYPLYPQSARLAAFSVQDLGGPHYATGFRGATNTSQSIRWEIPAQSQTNFVMRFWTRGDAGPGTATNQYDIAAYSYQAGARVGNQYSVFPVLNETNAVSVTVTGAFLDATSPRAIVIQDYASQVGTSQYIWVFGAAIEFTEKKQ